MKKYFAFVLTFFVFVIRSNAQDTLKFSRQQVAADVVYLFKNAEAIHPNLYHSITKQQLRKSTDSLLRSLPDSLSEMATFRAFAEATAFINEGHTGSNIPKYIRQQIKLGTFQSIPLQIIDYDNSTFKANLITSGLSLKKIDISSINGQSATSIFKKITALKGGLPSFKKVSAINYFRFYSKVIGLKTPYVINYQLQGKAYKIQVDALTEQDYLKLIDKPKLIEDYSYQVINNSIGCINFKSMYNYDRFVVFCDSIFKSINQQHITKLIIDLRENGGGNSALGRYLLDYVTDTPYRMAGNSERKVSVQFKEFISKPENRPIYGNDYDDYLKMQIGAYWQIGNNELWKPASHVNKFKGKVCFLIGPYTFSSANMLSATIKDFKLATLIGEPTGEAGNDYGELCNIELPQTGWIAFTSTTAWVRPNNDKTDPNPIFPDCLVEKTQSNEDNVLKFTINWLNK